MTGALVVRPGANVTPAALWGLAVALILLATPAGLVETLVASSGLSEALPAAAPPLGWKARLLLTAFGALMGVGVAWASRDNARAAGQENKDERRHGASGVKTMGFALSKLNWLTRARGAGDTRGSRPALRRADAHPDAPARTPIFASRDFGGLDIFPRVTSGRTEEAEIAEAAQTSIVLALPGTALPAAPKEAIDAEFEEIAAPAPLPARGAGAAPSVSARRAQPPSIAELTERLEQGLARRARTPQPDAPQLLADMPVEPPVPVRDRVENEADEALRAALEALRAMVDRTR